MEKCHNISLLIYQYLQVETVNIMVNQFIHRQRYYWFSWNRLGEDRSFCFASSSDITWKSTETICTYSYTNKVCLFDFARDLDYFWEPYSTSVTSMYYDPQVLTKKCSKSSGSNDSTFVTNRNVQVQV